MSAKRKFTYAFTLSAEEQEALVENMDTSKLDVLKMIRHVDTQSKQQHLKRLRKSTAIFAQYFKE
jgi:hypothetical protein